MSRRLVDVEDPDVQVGRKWLTTRLSPRAQAVLGCCVAVVLVGVGGVAPASADRLERADASGDMTAVTESSEGMTTEPAPDHRAGDVTSAVVRHRRHTVAVRLALVQLRRSHFNGFLGTVRTGSVTRHYVVEDARDARPRLYVVNKRFQPVCGRSTLDVDYEANTVAVRMPRRCLKRPDWVRVTTIAANDPGDGSNTYYLDDAFSASPVDASEGRGTWSARVRR